MANDLTGQNIQNTYQRVLHVGDDGFMYDGTGSLYTPISASHEITTETSSSHAISADTASFATNFTASGNISSSGTITTSGATIKGHLVGKNSGLNDSHLTGFTNIQGYGNFQMGNSETIDSHIITGRSEFVGNVTASSNISSSGTITATNGFGTINGGTW